MTTECEFETETVQVQYFLDVSIDGQSGPQRSGPFCNRQSAEAVVPAFAARSNVQKVVVVKEQV